ncbi:hypothetical protein L6452_33826 [Arctium lappa]|uniref:Uncharacterized protein n=1 Tax=Arctium lappa TaxID=4217 RepID=A0ACB8YGH0_ARCLA|nr:hypothetical protein L6452_33826 [Arctium lappa]
MGFPTCSLNPLKLVEITIQVGSHLHDFLSHPFFLPQFPDFMYESHTYNPNLDKFMDQMDDYQVIYAYYTKIPIVETVSRFN